MDLCVTEVLPSDQIFTCAVRINIVLFPLTLKLCVINMKPCVALQCPVYFNGVVILPFDLAIHI